ncbi:MAG: helix-turn-helix domain-containing protein [Bacillati bacterium ANGP1]|uniref:Helix-turn-helix domain-containing protein n=1 Tax=Candidatus Segetimicrobium genomatis TaxID=2569760 RepID=A0A537KXC6_9BACT|nr:MAG: helix-turn-helix domain-containing protein [Terrabacteria group bacterium ANGP1]
MFTRWNKENVREHHRPSSPDDTLGIGERLRNAREAKGLTLAAAETLTRIRAVYLEALEEEKFDRLPGAVYARGYLRTYALALGIDPDELMDAYPGAFNAPDEPIFASPPTEVPIRPAVPPSPLRRAALYAGGVVLLITAILGIIGYQQLHQFAQPIPKPAPPAAVGEPTPLPGKAEPAPGPTAQTGAVQPAAPQASAGIPGGGVELLVRAAGPCWLLVSADGAEVFQGFVQAGDVRIWRARERLTVRVGNSEAVSVLVNGQPVRQDPQRHVWEETFTAP